MIYTIDKSTFDLLYERYLRGHVFYRRLDNEVKIKIAAGSLKYIKDILNLK